MKRVSIMIFIALLFLFAKAEGRKIRVPADSSTIQKGINGANAGDTVLVAEGIYSAATNGEKFPVIMKSGVILLSVSGKDYTWIVANNDTTVIKCLNVDSTTIIKGFKICKGEAVKGGGIYCENSSAKIVSNKISDNRTVNGAEAGYGAGIYCQGGSPEIRSNEVLNNRIYYNGYGAGIYCIDSKPIIIGNVIDGDTIGIWGSYTKGYGAGIFCQNSSAIITDNIIQKNAIFGNYNGLWAGWAYGAGIYCYNSSSIKILRNTIESNICDIPYASNAFGAGLYFTYCTQPEIAFNLIISNIATSPTGFSYDGGGIYFDNCFSDSICNNTIDSNYGGGIFSNFSELRMFNNIISNSISEHGYGIKCETGSILQLSYNDVWQNAGENFSGCPAGTGDTTWGVNYNDTPCDSFYNIIRDPLFSTIPESLYHLQSGSPCINAGDPNSPKDPDSTIADMGAFYYHAPTDVTNDDEFSSMVNFELRQNYPNPFNPITQIEYSLNKGCLVRLTIYNILGQKVATLVDEYQSAGHKQVLWDGRDEQGQSLASGIYFYKLRVGDIIQSKKMTLLK